MRTPAVAPALSAQPARLHCHWTRQRRVPLACTDCRSSHGRWWTGATAPPESDDDEGDECLEYDVYGWFKFESDADGVQRLDRQWVPLHDLEQAEGWKAAILKLEEKLKKASSALTSGRTPAHSPES